MCGMIFIEMITKPEWTKHEKVMHTGTPDEQVKAADAFIEERTKETAVSRKARQWEESRKKELMDHKPKWVKEKVKDEHRQTFGKIEEFNKNLRKMGTFNDIQVMPGYVLIRIDDVASKETDSGIILTDGHTQEEPNTGVIVSAGDDQHMPNKLIKCPVREGDHVIFKRYAGLELMVNGQYCRFMLWDEVFATIKS